MSSDTADLPPSSQEIQDSLERLREMELNSALNKTLPALPGTPEAKLTKLAAPVLVSKEFFQNAINGAWLLSLRNESVTAANIARVVPNVFPPEKLEQLADLMKTEKFRLALLNRGIDADRTEADGLTAEMVACIRALSDPQPGLTVRQRLRGAGVSWEQYQGWMSFGPFRETLTRSSERNLKSAVALANAKLVENIDNGDLKAVQYLHELTGYFTPGKQQALDAQQMVRDVMTVVLRRVTDPETLLALAGDFRILQEKIMAGGDGSGSGSNNAAVVGFGESPATFDEIEVQ
jgi:hypothetical protein